MLQCTEYDFFFSIQVPRGLTPDIPTQWNIVSAARESNLLSMNLEAEEWVIFQQPFDIVKPSIFLVFMDFANT